MLASKADLLKSFNTTDILAICREILEKGDLQITELERQAFQETYNMKFIPFNEITTLRQDV